MVFIPKRSLFALGLYDDDECEYKDEDALWDNVIVKRVLNNEFVSHTQTSHRLDCLYELAVKKGKKAPPDFDPSALNLLLIEFDNKVGAKDYGKYISYFMSIINRYHLKLRDRVRIRFITIFGNSTSPKSSFNSYWDGIQLNPKKFFLRNSNANKLFELTHTMIENEVKAHRLKLLRILMLQKAESIDEDLLSQQIKLADALSSNDEYFYNFCNIALIELLWNRLTDDQQKYFEGSTEMSNYIAKVRNEGREEGREEGIEIGEQKGIEIGEQKGREEFICKVVQAIREKNNPNWTLEGFAELVGEPIEELIPKQNNSEEETTESAILVSFSLSDCSGSII
jgi:hypothetical protein